MVFYCSIARGVWQSPWLRSQCVCQKRDTQSLSSVESTTFQVRNFTLCSYVVGNNILFSPKGLKFGLRNSLHASPGNQLPVDGSRNLRHLPYGAHMGIALQ